MLGTLGIVAMQAAISNKTGGASCLPTTWNSTLAGEFSWTWDTTGGTSPCNQGDTISLICDAGVWKMFGFDVSGGGSFALATPLSGATNSFTIVSETPDPAFEIVIDVNIKSGFLGVFDGTFRMTITPI